MGISLLSCIVALAAAINCYANHCHSADPSFCKGNTQPWFRIYLFRSTSGVIFLCKSGKNEWISDWRI